MDRRYGWSRLLLATCCAGGLACTVEPSTAPERLLDELAVEATIEFPHIETVKLDDFEVIALQDMDWGVEDYRPEDAEGPSPVSGGVTPDVHHVGESSLWIEATRQSPACLISPWMRVLPNTSYSAMGYVRTQNLEATGALHGTFLLEELSEHGIERVRFGNHDGTSESWALETRSFQSGAQTDKVRLLACLSAPGGGTGRAWFDDIALVRSESLSAEAALRIARTRLSFRWRHDVASANRREMGRDELWGEDPAVDRFRQRVDLAGDIRVALLTPPPGSYGFRVGDARPARLRAALGVSNPGRVEIPGAVTFTVDFEPDEGDVVRALAKPIPMNKEDGEHWHPVDIALPPGPGRLVLSTRATSGLELAAAAFATPTLLRGDPTRKRRLVLLVSLDTLRADALGVYGAERPTSPELDALARRGVVFEHAHAPSSWTLPSHRTMLTGLQPLTHGSVIGERHTLRSEIRTLGEVLQSEGFRTVGIHGGGFVSPAYGFAEGFDRYVEIGEPSEAIDEAIRVVGDSGGQDLFLFFHNYQAHDPYLEYDDALQDLGPRYFELREQLAGVIEPDELGSHNFLSLRNESRTPLPSDQQEMLRLLYEAGVRRIDRELGRLFRAMANAGTLDDALIVVTSDHGDGLGEHGLLLHGNSLYRESLRVPLLIVQPESVPAGVRVETHVGTADVLPTLLDVLDIAPPADLDGRSLVSTWRSQNSIFSRWAEEEPPPVVGSLVQERSVLLSSVAGESKYILDGSGLKEELYDLQHDPLETSDIAATSRERLHAYRHQLAPHIAKLPGLHIVVVGEDTPTARVLTGTIGTGPDTPLRVVYLPCENCGLEVDDGVMNLAFPLAGKPLWLNMPGVRDLAEVPLDLQLDGQPLTLLERDDLLARGLTPGAYAFVTEGHDAEATQLSQERLNQLEALGYLD